MIKRKENVESHMSGNLLAKWIIGKAEKSEAYRAGTLTGMKHPKPDREMIKAAGGLPELIRQADELEKSGYIRTEKSNLGADMKKIYYSIDVIPKLCEKEGIEDPRKQQLRYIKQIEQLRAEVQNQYGTVINSQTLERAFPVSIKGVQRIVTIENKANYEEMKYREDTLYLFCHGFYSPKERIFLKRLMEVAEGEIQYFHWGDMDMGGIRIFRFNKKNIFPKLKPYKMDREAFQEALERGAGIPLEEKKKEKLEKLNAGELEELKKCILEKGVEIEQEILLAENAIAEN